MYFTLVASCRRHFRNTSFTAARTQAIILVGYLGIDTLEIKQAQHSIVTVYQCRRPKIKSIIFINNFSVITPQGKANIVLYSNKTNRIFCHSFLLRKICVVVNLSRTNPNTKKFTCRERKMSLTNNLIIECEF